jgi:RNA polymerase sigma-70 factor (ECF subfamily)
MERVPITDETSDRDLVLRLQAGAEAAFDELVRRHQARALHIAYQILRNHEDAVEVAQDAFVNVYRHIQTFRGDAEFTTWLHQIVVNLARNKHRWWKRRGRSASVSLDAPLPGTDGDLSRDPPSPADAPDAELVQAELVRQVDAAMEKLPRKFREVLVLRNGEELSYEEIAGVLRCSVGTVKSRIARARAALRELVHDL